LFEEDEWLLNKVEASKETLNAIQKSISLNPNNSGSVSFHNHITGSAIIMLITKTANKANAKDKINFSMICFLLF